MQRSRRGRIRLWIWVFQARIRLGIASRFCSALRIAAHCVTLHLQWFVAVAAVSRSTLEQTQFTVFSIEVSTATRDRSRCSPHGRRQSNSIVRSKPRNRKTVRRPLVRCVPALVFRSLLVFPPPLRGLPPFPRLLLPSCCLRRRPGVAPSRRFVLLCVPPLCAYFHACSVRVAVGPNDRSTIALLGACEAVHTSARHRFWRAQLITTRSQQAMSRLVRP